MADRRRELEREHMELRKISEMRELLDKINSDDLLFSDLMKDEDKLLGYPAGGPSTRQ